MIEKKYIIDFMSDKSYQPVKQKVLAKKMGVTDKDYPQFKDHIRALIGEGKVIKTQGGKLTLLRKSGLVKGTFESIRGGAGFVVTDDPKAPDIYIKKTHTKGAADGDEVAVKPLKRKKKGKYAKPSGRVVSILKKKIVQYVGTYHENKRGGYITVDGMLKPLKFSLGEESTQDLSEGQKVVAEAPGGASQTRKANLVTVLGFPKDKDVDWQSIVYKYGLPLSFPEPVLEEVKQFEPFTFDGTKANRTDLRNELVVTIDPEDAKDYDDAIGLAKTESGYRATVHIADVSFYVKPQTRVNEEAKKRGTSVYLCNHVVPMLPERLSNDLCSLKPNEERPAKTVIIEYDTSGNVLSTELKRTVITSRARLTYTEVDGLLKAQNVLEDKKEIVSMLRNLKEFTQLLFQKRLESGALNFIIPKPELVLDENDHVEKIITEIATPSHQIVEELMLAANEAIAKILKRKKISFLRRIHPEPDADEVRQLRTVLKGLGIETQRKSGRWFIREVIEKVRDHKLSRVINMLILRTLTRAEYSPSEEEHYALAMEDYTHFTSPIRRYPDLINHQMLEYVIDGRDGDAREFAKSLDLEDLGMLSSHLERQAESAEREMDTIKIMRYLEDKTDRVYQGIVMGIHNYGIFVELIDFFIDGLVKITSLKDDYYEYLREESKLVGLKTHNVIKLGDRVSVKIVNVDVDRRIVDLVKTS